MQAKIGRFLCGMVQRQERRGGRKRRFFLEKQTAKQARKAKPRERTRLPVFDRGRHGNAWRRQRQFAGFSQFHRAFQVFSSLGALQVSLRRFIL